MDQLTGIILAALALALIAGFVIGRVSVAVPELNLKPLAHLSDHALARIAHEARRAHSQLLGIFTVRAWNNLEEAERDRLARVVTDLRKGARLVSSELRGVFASVVALG